MTATNDPEPCDLLVAGGRVLDLAASAGVDDHAAIAIRAGFIVAVGDEAEIRSAWRPLRRIDAAGQVVAPGFVDAGSSGIDGLVQAASTSAFARPSARA